VRNFLPNRALQLPFTAAEFGVWYLEKKIRIGRTYALLALGLCSCAGEFPSDPTKILAAAAAYDEQILLDSLNLIEAWHTSNNTGVPAILRPGLSRSSLPSAISGDKCRLTEELKTLWSWRDGGIGSVPFIWYHDFLPLNDAVAEYKALVQNPLVRWDPSYMPVFSFEGEWYAAYCGEGSAVSGPIIHYFVEDEARITAVNLTMFIATMADAFQSGAIRWHDGGMAEDIQKVKEIHQQRNGGYAFPYYVPSGT
jgi:hypothetical protein